MDYTQGEDKYLINGGSKRSNTFYIIVAIFAIWNILMFSLAVSGVALARKALNDDDDSNGSTATSQCITSTIALYDEHDDAVLGSAVSLSPAGGSVRSGGGTSIYKLDTISADMPSLTDFVLVEINDTYALMVFSDSTGFLWTTLGTQEGADMSWSAPVKTNHQASNLASGARINTNLAAISSNQGIITIVPLPTPTLYMHDNTAASSNTQICALDFNLIAVSYPSGNDLVTAVATIEDNNELVWSNNTVSYAPTTTAHSIACFAPLHYVLSSVHDGSLSSQVILYSYLNGTVIPTIASTLQDAVVLPFVRSAPLKRSLAVGGVLYIDSSNNNALTLTAFSLTLDQLEYGSTLQINTGGEIDGEPAQKIADLTTLGVESGFVVSYSDWGNEEKITVLIGEITETNAVAAASPAYVLSPPNEDVFGEVYWNSVIGISDTDFVTVYALMNSSSSQTAASSVGHVFNTPLGIVLERTTVDGVPGVVVGVSGQCKVQGATVEAGYYYYSDGLGALFMPDPSQTTLDEYIDLGDMLLSKNSLVGVGISKEDLLIKSTPF